LLDFEVEFYKIASGDSALIHAETDAWLATDAFAEVWTLVDSSKIAFDTYNK
jgi:hypothetical protein